LGVKIRKIILFFLFLFLSIGFVSATMRINEIMYNPEGDDNNKEFIEIYSDEKINLSGFIIGDLRSNDTLTLLQYYDSDYYLIVEEGFNLSGIEASVYSAGATIGNNLNKDDSLFLYYNGTLIDHVSYTDICKSGYSLEYFNESFYCSFYLGGTPAKMNSDRNQDYSGIRINEFFPDPRGDDDAPMPDGEFIELYNKGEDIELAGLYLEDYAGHRLYITDTTTIDGTFLEEKSYLAVYMNKFSGFLNNEGFEEIRLYDTFENLIDKISYGGSEEALSWSLVDGIWQYRLPSPNEKNPREKVEMVSSFKIEGLEDVTDNESEFGDLIKVKFHVYKGNTTKSSIKLFIENDEDRITKTAKAMLHDRFTNYSLTLPVQIKPNCNEKYVDGDYYVKIGWTAFSKAEDTFKLKIEGINMKNCDKIYVERKPRKGTLKHSLLEMPGAVEINKEFTLKVEVMNNDEEDHVVDLYSYIYRGNKCYSGEREENKKSVFVKAGETKEFELENKVTDAEPGYKLKIKVKRDDQKTEKEVTQAIKVFQEKIEREIEEKIELKEEDKEEGYTVLESIKQPKIIYESSSIKAKKLVVYLFIGLLIIYAGVLTWRR
jgi:hypothetical protein